MEFDTEDLELLLSSGVIKQSTVFPQFGEYICLNKVYIFVNSILVSMNSIQKDRTKYTYYALHVHFKHGGPYDKFIPLEDFIEMCPHLKVLTPKSIFHFGNLPVNVNGLFQHAFNMSPKDTYDAIESIYHRGVMAQIDYIELIEYTFDPNSQHRGSTILQKHYINDPSFVLMDELYREYQYWHEINTPKVFSATPWV